MAALANWPGRIAPGAAGGVMHVVDMLPTLAKRSEPRQIDAARRCRCLAGLAAGQAGRTEVVYNIEPTQGAVRDGKWKLVWQVVLPPKAELFNLDVDPSETNDVSAQNPEKMAELQGMVVALARTMAPPLFYAAALKATVSVPLSTPGMALYEMGMEDD